MIVATAGHVDHGKTELIRALTGVDTDRLPEEKLRGLSIDLGFAYHTLPNGDVLGFVDVPGHEKFIRNMLAGVVGIDLGLLVVAADDGVMPQTREHLMILDLLGINQCLVALTKIDRVSPDRAKEVEQEIKTLFEDSGRNGFAIYPVNAPDNVGIEEIRLALGECAKSKVSRSTDGYFRMAIDRVFSLKGIGLIVTGMVFSGAVNTTDKLILSSDGSTIRIREIRAKNNITDEAKIGDRCALNIVGRGISEHSIKRGDWLMDTNLFVPSRRVDVSLKVSKSETKSLKHWTPVHLHIGSDHMTARVAVLSGGNIAVGSRGLAQLILSKDVFVVHGDRFVLRDQSAQRTIGGGNIIDPRPPKRGRSRPERIKILNLMQGETTVEILRSLAEVSDVGVALDQFLISHNVPLLKSDNLITSLGLHRIGKNPHERVFSNKKWDALLENIIKAITEFHNLKPNFVGPSIVEVQGAIFPFVEITIVDAAINALINDKRVLENGKKFHLPSHEFHVSEKDKILLAKVAKILVPVSGTPLNLTQVAQEVAVEIKSLEKTLKIGIKLGDFVFIDKNRYVPQSLIIKLKATAEHLASKSVDGLFTVVQYRDEVDMGRNFVISILEYFDRVGFSERTGNFRSIRRCAEDNQSVKSKN